MDSFNAKAYKSYKLILLIRENQFTKTSQNLCYMKENVPAIKAYSILYFHGNCMYRATEREVKMSKRYQHRIFFCSNCTHERHAGNKDEFQGATCVSHSQRRNGSRRNEAGIGRPM